MPQQTDTVFSVLKKIINACKEGVSLAEEFVSAIKTVISTEVSEYNEELDTVENTPTSEPFTVPDIAQETPKPVSVYDPTEQCTPRIDSETYTSPKNTNTRSNDEQRELIVTAALETPEGRNALAQAMVEPIKTSLMYQGLARKLLMVDVLPQGALPRYERDIAVKSYVIPKRGSVPTSIVEAEELLVPILEVAVNPTIKLTEIRKRKYYIVDRAQVRAKDSLQRQEDTMALNLIHAAVPEDHVIRVQDGRLTPDHFSEAIAMIESHELIAAKIVMHPNTFKQIRFWPKHVFNNSALKDILMTGLYGHIGTADVHVSALCLKNEIYVLAPAQFVGAMPIRQNITALSADDPKKLRLVWVVFEEIGMAIINDYALAKIVIGEEVEKTEEDECDNRKPNIKVADELDLTNAHSSRVRQEFPKTYKSNIDLNSEFVTLHLG